MATSGTISMGVYGDVRWRGRLKWSATTNTSTFKTTVTYTFQVYTALEGTTKHIFTGGTIFVDDAGTQGGSSSISSKQVSVTKTTWTTVDSKSFTISHSTTTGKAPVLNVGGDYAILYEDVDVFFSVPDGATITLNNISMNAFISSAPNFTDEENPTIKYVNRAGSSATKLEACISFDGSKDDIPYRNLSKTKSSYTFELTDEEREILQLGTLSGSDSRPIYFYIRSTVNGKTTTSKMEKTLTIVNANPTMDEPAVIDMNDDTFALTGDRNTFIKGYSTAACQTHARPQKCATVVHYKFVNGAQAEERDEDLCALPNVESDTFELSATDNRGLTTTKPVTVSMIDYFKPSCNQEVTIEKTQAETGAQIKIIAKGEWSSRHFGVVHNSLKVGYRYKANNEEYSEWNDTEYVTDDNTYQITFTIPDLDYEATYTVQTRAYDLLNSVETAEYPIKLIPVFDWSDEDFRFNVPVRFEKGFTFGDEEEASTMDYVIEQYTESMGSNGVWHCEKWKNGKAVCYGCRNFGNMAVSTAWGDVYRSAVFNQSLPSGLFADIPDVIDMSIRNAGYAVWLSCHEETAPSVDNTGSFMVVRAASSNVSAVHVSFHVIGSWK
jgi:hypothetical protein